MENKGDIFPHLGAYLYNENHTKLWLYYPTVWNACYVIIYRDVDIVKDITSYILYFKHKFKDLFIHNSTIIIENSNISLLNIIFEEGYVYL